MIWALPAAAAVSSPAAPADPPALNLAGAVRIALTESPAILDACDALRSSLQGLEIAEAEFGVRFTPQATSGLGVDTETSQSATLNLSKKFTTGTTLELSAGTASTEASFYRSFSGVTLSQSLLRGLGRLANTSGLAAAERRIDLSRLAWKLAREQVALDAAAAFYRVVGQKDVLAVLAGSSERSRQLLDATRAKLERGLATKIDLYRAEGQAASTQSSLLDAEEALAAARDSLRVILGIDLARDLEVASEIVPVEPADDPGVEGWVRQALDARVDLREAEDALRDAERGVRLAERNLWPDLRAGVNYSFTGSGDDFVQSTRFDDSSVRLLLYTSTSLDQRAERAQAEQARIELERRRRALVEERKRAVLEVRQAARHLDTVRRRIAIQENHVQAAGAGLDLARLRFERGYARMEEVLQAEQGLTRAQKEEIDLKTERVIAALRLRRAAGDLDSFVVDLLGGESGEGAWAERCE